MRPIALCLAVVSLTSSALAAPPELLHHQGRVFDALGAPIDGGHSLDFRLYDAPSGGSPVWEETQTLTLDNGYFAATLGSAVALDLDDFDTDEIYLEIAVDSGPALTGRVRIVSVPYAFTAANVDGGVVNATEIQINGSTVIDSSGTLTANVDWTDLTSVPTGFADDVDNDTLDELTGCLSDDVAFYDGAGWSCRGIDLGDLTGTVDINSLPVGSGTGDVAAGDHSHSYGFPDIGGTIATSQLPSDLQSLAGGGAISASQLPDPIASMAALSCSDGEVAVWSSGAWTCGSIDNSSTEMTQGVEGTFKMCDFDETGTVGCRPDEGIPVVCLRDANDLGNSDAGELFASDFLTQAAYWAGSQWNGTSRGGGGRCDHGVLMWTPTDSGGVATRTNLHHCDRADGSSVGCRYPQDGWPVSCARSDTSDHLQRGGFMVPLAHFESGEWRGIERGGGGACTYGVFFWKP